MNLTIYDYVKFAESSYSNDIKKGDNLYGWTVIETNRGINGFQAVALGKDNNGDGLYDEVVISYTGTNSLTDIIYDDFLGIINENIPGQYTGAMNFYNQIKNMESVSENIQITLTGHSLGGALAQLVAAKTGIPAITFNAPGMQYALSKIGCSTETSYDNVKNYIVMNDYIGNFREHIGTEYYYEPIPIQYDSFLDSHNGIFGLAQEELNYPITLSDNFGSYEGIALWYYDTNNVMKNILDVGIVLTTDILENAIEIIRNQIGETKRFLSYTTDNGMYILDNKEASHIINASDSSADTNGNDIVFANSGSDIVNGFSGDDILIGGTGDDTLYGGLGNDVLIAGNADNITISVLQQLQENKSNITSVVQYETDSKNINKLYGGEGDDLLIGDIGHDILVSGSGADYVYGGAGRDVLCNYANSSFLNGGYGDDRYDLKTGTTNTINDTDNKGTVHLNEYWVRGAEALFYLGSNVWHKDNITYTWNEDAKILTIQKDGDAGITTIENYENGALCITLEKPWSNPINADGIQSDPLIFDLNGDGIKTSLSPHQGIYYDYNNDGFAEKLSWSAYGDGVLVADTNNDGKIQGSGDILTSLTLASYDTNFDGKINYQDEYFNNLKIMDEEYNLYSLEEAGISSINLDYQNVNFTEENGNECKKIATYTKTNGQELQYGEYLVQTNPQNAIELNKLEETEAVSALPDIDNSGTVYSLHQAMLRDNELQTLVTSFTTETNDNVRMNLLEQIILKWTGAEDVEINSRGSHINAQHLAAIEAFDGIDFYSEYDAQYGEEGTNPSNPNKVRRLVRRLDFNLTELIEREERKVA